MNMQTSLDNHDAALRIASRLNVPAAALPLLSRAPALDAAPDFKNWAGPLVFQDLNGLPEKPPVETRGYLARDARHIYMAVRCEDPVAKEIASAPVPRDGEVWIGECVEFMLLPSHDPEQPYYHFVVNPAGSFYDAKGVDKDWNSGAKVFTAIDAAGWLAVVRVPLSALGVQDGAAPAIWRANLYRYRPARGPTALNTWSKDLHLAWSPTWNKSYHAPARFGVVAFPGGQAVDAAALEAWMKDTPPTVAPRAPSDMEAEEKEERPERPEKPVAVRITDRVITANFAGLGYHMYDHLHKKDERQMNEVFAKRWREVNPSFARLTHSWNWDWNDAIANMKRLREETQTEIYLATWDPKDTKPGDERAAYARDVVDMLERLVRKEGLANLRYYCLANELTLKGWMKLKDDLPKFKDYHAEIFTELQARKLDVKLLATDASPISSWDTIEWAAKNMDTITGAYGGHHYINDTHPKDDHFYPWFLRKMQWGADLARVQGKPFILGEYGAKPDGRTIGGIHMDTCVYWETSDEPYVSLQVGEAALAGINAGVTALGYWTFADFPDDPNKRYHNKWGLFKWAGTKPVDHSARPIYYAYGLLTKFFRGPATVYALEVSDPWVRVSAIQHCEARTWSVAAINRYGVEVPLTVEFPSDATAKPFRKYVYRVDRIPQNRFGDLPGPEKSVEPGDGRLTDALAPLSLTVYTTAYDDQPPERVQDVTSVLLARNAVRVSWPASAERDLCYYRVHRSDREKFKPTAENQVGSTVATEFEDEAPPAGAKYKIVAVDQSGNASE